MSSEWKNGQARSFYFSAFVLSCFPLLISCFLKDSSLKLDVVRQDIEQSSSQDNKYLKLICKSKNITLMIMAFVINMAGAAESSLLFLYFANQFETCQSECLAALTTIYSLGMGISSLFFLPLALRKYSTMAILRFSLICSILVALIYCCARSLSVIYISTVINIPTFSISCCMDSLFSEAGGGKSAGSGLGTLEGVRTFASFLAPPVMAFLMSEWRFKEGFLPGAPWMFTVLCYSLALLLSFRLDQSSPSASYTSILSSASSFLSSALSSFPRCVCGCANREQADTRTRPLLDAHLEGADVEN